MHCSAKIYLQVPITLAVIAVAYLAYREFTSTFGDPDSGTTRSCQERGVAYYKEIGRTLHYRPEKMPIAKYRECAPVAIWHLPP